MEKIPPGHNLNDKENWLIKALKLTIGTSSILSSVAVNPAYSSPYQMNLVSTTVIKDHERLERQRLKHELLEHQRLRTNDIIRKLILNKMPKADGVKWDFSPVNKRSNSILFSFRSMFFLT